MTTTPTVEEYLLLHGPAKVSVIAKNVHMSETTVRKHLKSLESDGHVKRDDSGMFEWIAKKAKKAVNGVNQKRVEIDSRDRLVLSVLEKKASVEGESLSRNDVLDLLAKDGHKFTGSFVYLSLYRLHSRGDIERVHVGKRAPEWRIAYHRD